MMTYTRARSIQFIVIFSVVILAGAVVSIYSEFSTNKGEVEGVQDEVVVEESIASDLNVVPIFKSEPPINGYVGEEYSYFVSVSDSDSSELTLSVLKGPEWLKVNSLEVSGIPTNATSSEGIKVILEISDGENSTYQVFYLNIVNRDEIE